MDPSALIFVALVVAWAVYLVPKALENHDESLRKRTVATVSNTMRVLARREKRGGRSELVADPDAAGRGHDTARPNDARPNDDQPAPQYVEVPVEIDPAVWHARRLAARRATKRRRNVLGLILVALVTVAVLAGVGVLAWPWVAAPGGVTLAWLVACRLMVRTEREVPTRRVRIDPVVEPEGEEIESSDEAATGARMAVLDETGHPTGTFIAIDADTGVGRWDPVSVPLPTYVSKPVATRAVRSIDLDSTGVWSSGRNESDSALAREADVAEAARRDAERVAAAHRATGS